MPSPKWILWIAAISLGANLALQKYQAKAGAR